MDGRCSDCNISVSCVGRYSQIVIDCEGPVLDREKYITMAERLVVTGCLVLPGFWWISVLGAWILKVVVSKMRKVKNISWTSILIGNGTAVVCGLLIRSLFYT